MTTATVIPAEYALIIPQRATLREVIEFPFAWNAHQAYAQVFTNYARNTLIAELDIEDLEFAPNWKIAISAPWDAFTVMFQDGVWDLLVVNEDGSRDHYLKGPAIIDFRVSEVPPP